MHFELSIGRWNLNVAAFLLRLPTRLSRLLLTLAALVILATPFTQHLWTWDNFFHGGQDFETTMLLVLVSYCLLFVLARSGKQGMDLFLSAWRFLRIVSPQMSRTPFAAHACSTLALPITGPPSATHNLPLLI